MFLWENIRNNNRDAYSQLYISFYNKFYNYARKFTDDIPIVEDAIQEVLIAVWTNRHRLNTIANPDSYFFSSFRNVLFKKLKEEVRDASFASNDEPEFSAEYILINKELDDELRTQLKEALSSLTPRQREAIYLRFYEGFSYEEVAQMLNITVKATYKIMARGLLQLRDKLSLPVLYVLLMLCVPN